MNCPHCKTAMYGRPRVANQLSVIDHTCVECGHQETRDPRDNDKWVAIPQNFKPRYRLESVNGKSKLIDLETGEDLGKIVESVSVFVDYEGVQATITLAHGQVDCAIDIPVGVKPVPTTS